MHKSESVKKSCLRRRYLSIGVVIAAVLLPVYALGGSMQPPNGPGVGTRYTLKHIYDLINVGTTAVPSTGLDSGFAEPLLAPSATVPTFSTLPSNNTLADIYSKAPHPDSTNGAVVGDVCDTKTFYSLIPGASTWGPKTGNKNCNVRPTTSDYFRTGAQNISPYPSYEIDYISLGLITDDTTVSKDRVTIDTTSTKGSAAHVTSASNHKFTYNTAGAFADLPYGVKAYDSFTYTYTDDHTPVAASDTATIFIEITGVNHVPVIATNKSMGMALASSPDFITSARLSTIDPRTSDTLTYTVSNLSSGTTIEKLTGCTGSSWNIATTFTQAEVNDGTCVRYSATSIGVKKFDFSVTDATTPVTGTFDIYVY